MTKRLILLVAAVLCFAVPKGYALETVRVVVLPFEIHSMKDLSYMKTEIPRIVEKYLKQEGAVVAELKLAPDFSWTGISGGIDGIRNMGVQNGADYVVWGSLTWLGEKFSLDAKLARSYEDTPPQLFFVEGSGIENLFSSVKRLSEKIALQLFKRETVVEVRVEGNKRIESDAIKRLIKTAPGDIFLAKSLTEDLKSVYEMGYFDDIRIEAEEGPDGKVIIFKVKEKPTIRRVHLKGNRHIEDDDIKEAINIRTGSILNVNRIKDAVKQIENLYKEKNYHNVRADYTVEPFDNNQADVKFEIEEGEKVRIKSIIFEGNSAYPDKKLKKMMETSEKGFFSWLTYSGELKMDELQQDVAKLSGFYHNSGFIQAKIGEPKVEIRDQWIDITIKIDEGPQFKVGKVEVTGDLIFPKQQLMEKLKITKEEFYNREIVRSDVLVLTDAYSDEGYAYADVSPVIDRDTENLRVNIAYNIKKNKQVYFESIIISGNTKTRDKVIRRELRVYEREIFSGRGLKRGVRNLYRLDYFEDVKVDTMKGSADDQMVLKINVSEKPTGALTFGGGYSSVEEAFIMVSVSQRNLFGLGQKLELKGELGGTTNRYNISFTEPWLFDIPLSAGFDIYKWDTDYDTYDKDSVGGGMRFSYPVFDYTRVYVNYSLDASDITNVAANASDAVKELEGTSTTSSVTTMLRYDSRNNLLNPSEGSEHSVSVEYAGLGGNVGFTKYLLETGWYQPLYKDLVGFVHGKTGLVQQNSQGKLPDYERFYLGGMNSLRGFDWQDVAITKINKDGYASKIGGDKFVQFNLEVKFPIMKDSGVYGVVFFDTGNVYDNDESIDLTNMRESVGYGFRWYSPVGPIRLEYGYVLDPKEGESRGGWEFSMGAAFF